MERNEARGKGPGKAFEPIQTVRGSSWRRRDRFMQEMEVNGGLGC